MVQLANRFANNGYHVTFVTTQKKDDEYQLEKNIERISLDSCLNSKNALIKNLKIIFKLRNICKKNNSNLLITFMREPNVRGILATLGLKTKSIISVRNEPDKEYFGKSGKLIANRILPLSSGCIFQTNDAQLWANEKLKKKSIVIKNTVDESFFHVNRENDLKNIVTIGRLTEQKNQSLLTQAFKDINREFPDEKLLIYGEGNLESQLKSEVEKESLSDRIFFMGQTTDVKSVLSKAKIFVLSSNYEGMPNALMEALAVGVPSISTNCPCGGPKDLIENKQNGILVPVNEKNELVDALSQLLSNQSYATEISQNAKRKAKKFHPNNIFLQWKEYIDSFLD